MERQALHRLIVLTVLAPFLVGVLTSPAVAGGPRIEPFNTTPAGQIYGRWAAAWWQWALGIPLAVNPLVDTTGEHCAQRQVDAVWFLAGSVSPTLYGAFLNDPPSTRTDEFVRAAGSCTVPVQISVSLDGHDVPKATRFFTGASGSQSPFFNVQLPPGNVFGFDETVVPELVLSPSAEQGYYLFLRPLRRGSHTFRWTASGCTPGNSQDITYHLDVVGVDPGD
jgi:hypothetical protein